MTSNTILVTGATGKTGSRISKLLELKGHQVRRVSTSSDIRFDWEIQDTWAAALNGVKAVYICYYPDFAFPGALDTLAAFVNAAKSNGVTKLVMITGRGEHFAELAESLVLDSGIPSTILRSAWFAQNFSEGSLHPPLMRGVIPMPGDDPGEPIVDLNDFAEIAAIVLTEEGHEGRIYEITGPRVITFSEVAATLTAALDRPIRYLPISFDEFHAELAQATNTQYADIVTKIARETFDGRNAFISRDAERLLGRAPNDFVEFAITAAKSDIWALTA